MKKLLVLVCPYLLSGCAYVEDRARDAADMITVAAEFPSIGAAVWGGSRGVGLTVNPPGHGFGLRSGAVGLYECGELVWFNLCFRQVCPSEMDRLRGKGYDSGIDWCSGRSYMQGGWFNYGQVEVVVGVGPGVRVGVNFIEIADFIVGFLGIDLCDDDIAGRRSADATAPKPPPTRARKNCGAGGCVW